MQLLKKIVPDNLYPGLNQGASTIFFLILKFTESGRIQKIPEIFTHPQQ